MLTPNDKEKFLAELEEVPFPSVACKRAGIAKATIYRWRNEDAAYKKAMDASIETGREGVTDMAEAHTLMLLKKGDFRAIRLWLENNTTRYHKPKKAIAAPRIERQIKTLELSVINNVDDYRSGYEDGFKKASGKDKNNNADLDFESPPPKKPPPFVSLKLRKSDGGGRKDST